MMGRLGLDTLFGRIFSLLLGVVVASHLSLAFFLVFGQAVLGLPLPPGSPPPSPLTPPSMWIIMGTQFVALTLGAWFGARMLANPIRRLSQAATRLADNLDSPQIAEAGPREIRQAARTFNRMQEKIRLQLRQRAVFLAAVSHDLRTPLTRMKLRLERLEEDETKSKLRGDLNEMASLLNATLEYLRDEVEVEPWQMFDVQALAESLAEDAGERGGDVTVSGQARPIMARPTSLRRCLSNLIENALRYGRLARVSLQDSPSILVIEVEDDGPGIPEHQMSAVLEPFVRLEESRNKASGGFGLGLSIAREAVRRQGGDLILRNRREGGLTVRLTIPHNP